MTFVRTLRRLFFPLLLSFLVPATCLTAPQVAAAADGDGRLTVFAAASLKDALEPLADAFRERSSVTVNVALAGSSMLARQIQHGAPADLFISANRAWMDLLEQDGLLVPGSRADLLANRLVLIGPAEGRSPSSPPDVGRETPLAEMLGEGRLAMALTRAVPAGIYGRQALERLGLWPSVAGRLAETDNVRAALALVASGETPLGIVYESDAVAEPRVVVVGRFDAGAHEAIVYPAAAIRGGRTNLAGRFLEFLRRPESGKVFEAHGFIVPGR